jgi:IMP dehydrogenase
MLNDELFEAGTALTFDDILVVPGYSGVLPSNVDIGATLVAGIHLKAPLLSAAMDTVTEARLAIALARMGGFGIIHRNLSPEAQAAEVKQVKRSESGMIRDPVSLPETATLADAERIMETWRVSGVPVVDSANGRLIGIITNRDRRFCGPADAGRPVGEFMTREGLVTAPEGTGVGEAKAILRRHKIEKLPLVDAEGRLRGLITARDIQKKLDYPQATLDSGGRLRVGAAVGVGQGLDERVALLTEACVDALVVDTAHGHSKGVIEAIRRIRAAAPGTPVIAGNVVTEEGTLALIEAGASAIKVGVGAGSICTTRVIAGVGMPQMSAIHLCSKVARKRGIPVIADGGIKFSGDIVKALAAGADTVMLGSLLAGLEESPGELVLYEGRQFKSYRGMGSLGALEGYGRDRYGTGQGGGKLVPEGVEGMVPYRGHLAEYVAQLLGGLRSGMGYAGVASLKELREKARLVRISGAGLLESHPHSITITREAPNYQRGE